MKLLKTCLFPMLLAVTALAAAPPKLVVVVSVDQLSAELMERWGKTLPGGLGRLYREGATFTAAYQDHGFTETGPGHSVILTGRAPMHTGIVENKWLDRATGQWLYCVTEPQGQLLGTRDTSRNAGPRNLQGDTLGAWLQAQIPGSRVFAVTGKDRSAILMAGHHAQGVYWFAEGLGYTSSTAYTQTLPGWLQAYNAGFLAGAAKGSVVWTPLDGQGQSLGGTYQIRNAPFTAGLPRTLASAGGPRNAAFWDHFKESPFLDQSIFGAAKALEDGEKLGQGPGVDLLALGLSATDYVGHGFGNGGPEMYDQLRRLDLALGQYLERLRAKVPGVWVILTADHGSGDFPERLEAKGIPAKRLNGAQWLAALNAALTKRLGGTAAFFLPNAGSHQFYLDPAVLRASGKSRAEVLKAAAEVAKASPEVAEACTGPELDATLVDPAQAPDRRDYKALLRLSYVAGRSGDLLLAFKPQYTVDDVNHAMSHGHPQDRDRRVPLIFWGPWKAQLRPEPVRITDLAPTLARELGLTPAEPVDGVALSLPR